MELDKPLGEWLSVERNTYWECYRTESTIIFREDEGETLQEFKGDSSGFFTYSGEIDAVPIKSHPIVCQRIDQRFWTRKPMRISPPDTTNMDILQQTPGHVITDTLGEVDGKELILGSDGSVHLFQKVAAAAWLATAGPDNILAATFLMTDISSVSSYRSELEGIFRSLKHLEYKNVTPTMVQHWCDNERGVISSNTPPWCPADMMKADADLVLAIHHLKSTLPFPVKCQHVYGHQDSKKRKKKEEEKEDLKSKLSEADSKRSPTPPTISKLFGLDNENEPLISANQQAAPEAQAVEDFESLNDQAMDDFMVNYVTDTEDDSDEESEASIDSEPATLPTIDEEKEYTVQAQINMAADKYATETTAAALDGTYTQPGPALHLPYPGSKAMLKINGVWITSKHKRVIYAARRVGPMRTYATSKYRWTNDTFNSVYWDSVGRVRRKMTHNQQRQTCKLMHGWLPVMHMRTHITGMSQCPGCRCPDETIEHFFQCPNPIVKKKQQEIVQQLRKKGLKAKIPKQVLGLLTDIIISQLDGTSDVNTSRYDAQLQKVIVAQQEIGFHMLMRGFLAKAWHTHLKFLKVPNPERRMDSLLQIIWNDVFYPLWEQRNQILHDEKSKYNLAENRLLTQKILWYVQHKHLILAGQDQFLANHDLTRLHKLKRKTKRQWIKHLDRVREAYDKERRQIASRQNVITQYLTRRTDGGQQVG
jgi:hypothetical protein